MTAVRAISVCSFAASALGAGCDPRVATAASGVVSPTFKGSEVDLKTLWKRVKLADELKDSIRDVILFHARRERPT